MKKAALLLWIQFGQVSVLCAAHEANVYQDEPLSWSVTAVRISWEFDQKTDPAAVRLFNEKADMTLAEVDGCRGFFEAGGERVLLESDNPFREMGLCALQQQQGLKRQGDFCLTPFQESTLRTCKKALEEIREKGADICFRISLVVTVYNSTPAAIILDGSAELPVTFEDVPSVMMKPERPLKGLNIPGGGTNSADIVFFVDMSSEQMFAVLATLKHGAAVDLLRARMRILQEGRDVRTDLLVAERQTYSFIISNGTDDLISWKVRKRSGARGAELTFRELLEAVNAAGWKSDGGRALFAIKDGRCVGVGDLEAVGKDYLLLASHGPHRRFFLWDWPLDAPIKGNVRIWLRHPVSRTFGNMMEGRALEGLLRYEAATHDASAQIMLGECCRRRRGMPTENPEGTAWFQKAAAQGNAAAMCHLYECYKNGWGVGKSERESMGWLRKAAEQGDAEAQCGLGTCFKDGRKVNEDSAEAVRWYRQAADQGFPNAQHWLAHCYADGLGVPRNDREAIKWYRMAAEQGHMKSQYHLGFCLQKGAGVDKNEQEALLWLRRAALQGYEAALFLIGRSYDVGRGVKLDQRMAAQWYTRAAKMGHCVAQSNLGYLYQNGLGVTKDQRRAVELYRRAAENGSGLGQNNLGYCYKNGIGIGKDGHEAVKWLRRALENGSDSAHKTLGLCYLEGFGVEKDEAEGVRLLRKAVEMGITSAQDELNKIGK